LPGRPALLVADRCPTPSRVPPSNMAPQSLAASGCGSTHGSAAMQHVLIFHKHQWFQCTEGEE
jgi:hypothetical protein